VLAWAFVPKADGARFEIALANDCAVLVEDGAQLRRDERLSLLERRQPRFALRLVREVERPIQVRADHPPAIGIGRSHVQIDSRRSVRYR
jgi:hypothetical protein